MKGGVYRMLTMEKAGADQKEKAPDKNTATPVYRGKPGTVRKDRP